MPSFLPNLAEFASHPRRLVLTLLVCCSAVNLSAASSEEVDPAQVDKWIVQLDDDLYAVRKRAQQGLESSGQQALEAIAEEARNGTLESSTRALNVMLAWTKSKNHELQLAALEQLVALPNRPIESGLAAELLADSRERVALEAIVAFGGKFKPVGGTLVVKQQPNLQIIIDEKWKGELAGLKHLAAVRRATTISFYFAPLDDGVYEYLASLPNVNRVEFYGTPISGETAERLKIPLSTEDIFLTKGALLGIHGDGFRQGPVIILKANEGFAAANAGLLKGDAITEIAGEKVKDFRDLTRRIGRYKPGETAELTILRGGELIKKQVTFDRWGKQVSVKEGQAPGGALNRQTLPPPRRIILEPR